MKTIFAADALLPDGWVKNLRVEIDDAGRIGALQPNAVHSRDDVVVKTLLPALGNLHSHTFQRAMAGMTERRGKGEDSFWSWRDLMYRFLDHLTPEDVETIAALAFIEMLEAGYASVGEFHYLHHAPGGATYANPAEMSDRIAAAASASGIGLTLLPVLYSYGGAEQKPLAGGQLRFGNDVERFARLVEAASQRVKSVAADASIGIAPHSLRATSPDVLRALLQAFPTGPVHIHVAEQQGEVDQVLNWLRARPVQFLLDSIGIDQRWCLIHATHMTEDETRRTAESGAVAGLCPVTEANLGDGIFPGKSFLECGGAFGVGTDSNINIGLADELRLFEYSQRLSHRSRNVLAATGASVGETLYVASAQGAAQALGRDSGAIRVGAWADLVAINSDAPRLALLTPQQIIDGWIFAASDGVVDNVWSAGRHCVRHGRHHQRDAIESRYRMTMKKIVGNL